MAYLLRAFLILGFLTSSQFAVARAASAEEASAERPNFVVVLMDNLGQDWFGCHGSVERQTPQIDKLAQGGVRFRNCYVVPLCSTSRHIFLTGRYPFRTGWTIHHDSAIYGGGYFDWKREVCFARVLRSAGYATAIAGKWQINNLFDQPDALENHGFDEHCIFPEGPKGHPAHTKRYWDPFILRNGKRIDAQGKFGPDVYVDSLIDFIGRHRNQPFLAFYSMVFAHLPATKTPWNRNDELTEREQLAGMVRYADHGIGRIVAALDDLGLRKNTIVLLTTDNGTPAIYGGRVEGRLFQATANTMVEGDMREGSINVPLIVNGPGLIPGGRVSDALADNSDIFPTLLELAGVRPPEGVVIDGKSLAGILRGAADEESPRQWIFSQYAHQRVLRDARYKLRWNGRFHDLVEDPLEERDLCESRDPEIVAARARLQGVLDSFPADAKRWFTPRSISARRLGIGTNSQRARQAKLAPIDPADKKADGKPE